MNSPRGQKHRQGRMKASAVCLTHGPFAGVSGHILRDFGWHATLSIPGAILNVPAWMFARLA